MSFKRICHLFPETHAQSTRHVDRSGADGDTYGERAGAPEGEPGEQTQTTSGGQDETRHATS